MKLRRKWGTEPFGVAAPTLLVVLLAVILTTLATGAFSGRRLARRNV